MRPVSLRAGASAARPVAQRRLTIRADVGDSKNMKAESKQAEAPEQG